MTKKKLLYQRINCILLKAMYPYRFYYLLMLLGPVFSAFYVFANNYSLKLLIDAFTTYTTLSWGVMLYPILLFSSAQILVDLGWRIRNYAQLKSEPYILRNIIIRSYAIIQRFPYQFFQNTPTGTIISHIKSIVENFQVISEIIIGGILNSLMILLLSVFLLLLVNPIIFYFLIIWAIVFIVVSIPMLKKMNILAEKASWNEHDVVGILNDNITNIYSIINFVTFTQELKKINQKINQEMIPERIKALKYNFFYNSIASILYWMMIIGIFTFMIYLRKENLISPGNFVFAILCALNIAIEMWRMLHEIGKLYIKIGALKSALSILNTPMENSLPNSKNKVPLQINSITFKNLVFHYHPDKPVIEKLNLHIKKGEKIGIVGLSGAGKSTLIALLMKNYHPIAGKILINNKNIENIDTALIHKAIRFIPQDTMLFHRSIYENIAYGSPDATLKEVIIAAKKAHIHEFIISLPHQYETIIGNRGITVSGGQRQRLAIARALLKQSSLIILDEATSDLDSLAEQKIQDSLERRFKSSDTTMITIAHRLSTIQKMDRIVVIHDGKIVEEGTFKELIHQPDGFLKKIWHRQMHF